MINDRIQRSLGGAALAGAVLALASCGGGSSSGSGSLSLGITDMPLDVGDVTRVQITFDRIDLKPAEGPVRTIELTEPRTIENLLDLQGGAAEAIFEGETVSSGQYNWIRLFVIGGRDDSLVVDGGGVFDLFIPGQQPRANAPGRFLQLSSPFFVPAGGTQEITIDVELRKALVKLGGTTPSTEPFYLLRPSLRLIDNSNAGHLVGGITLDFVQSNCPDAEFDGEGNVVGGLAVYVFEGFNATPGDLGDPDNPPVSTDEAELAADENYDYRIGFLEAGEYTAAVTCEAKSDTFSDDPDVNDDEDLEFVAQENVEIIAGNEPKVLNFN